VINTAGVIVALSRNIDKMPIFTCNGIDATIFLYAFIGIKAMVSQGIVTGYTDNTFKPGNAISRAEFITQLSDQKNWL
jgi:hypothetical protein